MSSVSNVSIDKIEHPHSSLVQCVPAFGAQGLRVLSTTISVLFLAIKQTFLFTQQTHNRAWSSTIDGCDDAPCWATYISHSPRHYVDKNLSCSGCRASYWQLASPTLILDVNSHRFRRPV